MFLTFNNIYSFIIKLTVIVLGVIITAISLLVSYFLLDNTLFYFIFFVFGVTISIIVGSYIYVILSIPLLLPQKFDSIKNSIALNKYSTLQELQSEICRLKVDL